MSKKNAVESTEVESTEVEEVWPEGTFGALKKGDVFQFAGVKKPVVYVKSSAQIVFDEEGKARQIFEDFHHLPVVKIDLKDTPSNKGLTKVREMIAASEKSDALKKDFRVKRDELKKAVNTFCGAPQNGDYEIVKSLMESVHIAWSEVEKVKIQVGE